MKRSLHAFALSVLLFACGTSRESPSPSTTPAPSLPGDAVPPPTDGNEPQSCSGTLRSIRAWVAGSRACASSSDCTRVEAPAENVPDDLCGFAVSSVRLPDGELERFTDAWTRLRCGQADFQCPDPGGVPRCEDGTCVLDHFEGCEECFTLPEKRVCTTSGLVAFNACAAEACFGATVKHEGDCGTSPACAARGGTCTYTNGYESPCPDGTRWDLQDPHRGCADGQLEVRCCAPSSLACTFFGGNTFQLSIDPFTCSAQPTCLAGIQNESCTYSASLSETPQVPAWNADVTIEAGPSRAIRVTGVHAETGRTFECTGTASDELGLVPTTWSCAACAAGGGDCITCGATHGGLCTL